ncbi:MAG TPA: hypothetical protein VGW39_02880 [Chthoniobacterales bacterium]|nr:hypothetical protein [Chthoniobacterales bacterium]
MPKLSSLGNSLLRTAVALGFFGYLVVHGTLFSHTSTSKSPSGFFARPSDQSDAVSSDSTLTDQVKIGLPDEFGVAFEDDDSIEMVRVDVPLSPFGGDRVENGPRVVSKGARIARPDISPPLLL